MRNEHVTNPNLVNLQPSMTTSPNEFKGFRHDKAENEDENDDEESSIYSSDSEALTELE